MKNNDQKARVSIPLVIMIGIGMAAAGSHGGAEISGVPVFALSVGMAFAIQWVMFIPAYLLQSERFFDLTGSLTYISVTVMALLLSGAADARSLLLGAMVVIWAGRLGLYLFRRVRRAGKDTRFDEIKPSFVRFLSTWTLQGLWVSLTLAAALAAITATNRRGIEAVSLIGFLVWALGLTIEAAADAQKSRFRADPANRGTFIHTGLWARSRHPNYFGEITLWVGAALVAVPVLSGWQWLTLISPVFVALLITRVSGVPILEKRADEKWGGQRDYEAYKARTPVLIPRL